VDFVITRHAVRTAFLEVIKLSTPPGPSSTTIHAKQLLVCVRSPLTVGNRALGQEAARGRRDRSGSLTPASGSPHFFKRSRWLCNTNVTHRCVVEEKPPTAVGFPFWVSNSSFRVGAMTWLQDLLVGGDMSGFTLNLFLLQRHFYLKSLRCLLRLRSPGSTARIADRGEIVHPRH